MPGALNVVVVTKKVPAARGLQPSDYLAPFGMRHFCVQGAEHLENLLKEYPRTQPEDGPGNLWAPHLGERPIHIVAFSAGVAEGKRISEMSGEIASVVRVVKQLRDPQSQASQVGAHLAVELPGAFKDNSDYAVLAEAVRSAFPGYEISSNPYAQFEEEAEPPEAANATYAERLKFVKKATRHSLAVGSAEPSVMPTLLRILIDANGNSEESRDLRRAVLRALMSSESELIREILHSALKHENAAVVRDVGDTIWRQPLFFSELPTVLATAEKESAYSPYMCRLRRLVIQEFHPER